MPNPKGNPDIVKYGFKTDRAEPCNAQISVRIPQSLKAQLKDIDNWQEGVREYLEKIVARKSA